MSDGKRRALVGRPWRASQEPEHLREARDTDRETRLQELEDAEHRRDYVPREGSDMEGEAA